MSVSIDVPIFIMMLIRRKNHIIHYAQANPPFQNKNLDIFQVANFCQDNKISQGVHFYQNTHYAQRRKYMYQSNVLCSNIDIY